jgi:hypothetical protein
MNRAKLNPAAGCPKDGGHLTLQSDADIKTAFAAMRKRLRSGGTLLISMRDYGSLIAQRAPSTLPAFYRDNQSRRIVHQVWDWLDDRRYVLHLFITMEKPDGWSYRRIWVTA